MDKGTELNESANVEVVCVTVVCGRIKTAVFMSLEHKVQKIQKLEHNDGLRAHLSSPNIHIIQPHSQRKPCVLSASWERTILLLDQLSPIHPIEALEYEMCIVVVENAFDVVCR